MNLEQNHHDNSLAWLLSSRVMYHRILKKPLYAFQLDNRNNFSIRFLFLCFCKIISLFKIYHKSLSVIFLFKKLNNIPVRNCHSLQQNLEILKTSGYVITTCLQNFQVLMQSWVISATRYKLSRVETFAGINFRDRLRPKFTFAGINFREWCLSEILRV